MKTTIAVCAASFAFLSMTACGETGDPDPATATGAEEALTSSTGIVMPLGHWHGKGELIAGQVQTLKYDLSVNIALDAGKHTWTQTFNFDNGMTVTNVFVATLNASTGFVKILSVNGVAQTNSNGYCANNQFTSSNLTCTFRWTQDGAGQEDTATFGLNGFELRQFASDETLTKTWHDRSLRLP